MEQLYVTQGIILKQSPQGEYDRRLEILTVDRGKITAFARGARRQGGRFTASTDFFCFGEFKLYPGKESYSLSDASISEFFVDLRNDFEATLYGMYFLELTAYHTRENVPEKELLKSLYVALKSLTKGALDKKLIKVIFELKVLGILGEYELKERPGMLPATVYAEKYVLTARPEELFAFTLVEEAYLQLKKIVDQEKEKRWHHSFKTEEMLIDY